MEEFDYEQLKFLLKLDPVRLEELCKTDKKIEKLCQNRDFWFEKIETEFPEIPKKELESATEPAELYMRVYLHKLNEEIEDILIARDREISDLKEQIEETNIFYETKIKRVENYKNKLSHAFIGPDRHERVEIAAQKLGVNFKVTGNNQLENAILDGDLPKSGNVERLQKYFPFEIEPEMVLIVHGENKGLIIYTFFRDGTLRYQATIRPKIPAALDHLMESKGVKSRDLFATAIPEREMP